MTELSREIAAYFVFESVALGYGRRSIGDRIRRDVVVVDNKTTTTTAETTNTDMYLSEACQYQCVFVCARFFLKGLPPRGHLDLAVHFDHQIKVERHCIAVQSESVRREEKKKDIVKIDSSLYLALGKSQ